MFPEYQDLISKLNGANPHFSRMYSRHGELDEQIQKMERGREQATPLDIEKLKKEKLHLKDQLYAMLKDAG